ncbi:MAG: UbiA prenyltransferase family protein [Candidatus ainarchaeum sp.]|nr:UbiA prenyltransferase family protein [Candidatus ainarchaeum sp.]
MVLRKKNNDFNKKLMKKKSVVKNQKEQKIQYPLIQKIFGLIELGRPIEWSKSLLNMFLAALMVYYIYNIFPNPIVFLIGFASVAFLWSGLYALNDYTDWKIDLLHPIKKNRPIPSGKVTPKQGFIFSIILILISFSITFLINNFLLFFCLSAMLLNQLLYTMEPYRLKSRKVFDVISGSMINPFFRYFSGIVLFISFSRLVSNPFPILPIIFVVGIQFSGYSLYRLFSKSHDTKIKMKSSVALLPEKLIKTVSYFVLAISILSYFLLLVNGLFFQNKLLGFLPPQYFLAIIIVALFVLSIPSLRLAILNPQKADMKSSYRLLYLMNVSFVIANLIIFIFLR